MKHDSKQTYFFTFSAEFEVETDNYDDALKRLIDEINALNKGKVQITEFKGKNSGVFVVS